jgi:hypothetical protein
MSMRDEPFQGAGRPQIAQTDNGTWLNARAAATLVW